MRVLRRVVAGALFVAAATAADAQTPACMGGETRMLQVELLFGRSIGGRLGVTDTRWAKFLAAEVTPRFPDGLTAIDGRGQWRDPASGRITREASKILMIVTADDATTREKIAAVVDAYKTRFRQKSVGVVTRPVCAAF